MITQLDRQDKAVNDKDQLTEKFFLWMLNVTNLAPLSGSGSPEGVVEARMTRLYMDEAGTAGAILYIKRLNDIGGDRTQGWILT